MYFDFHFSSQGHNHQKDDKVCQDASWSYSNDNASIAVVADGHGSNNYPRTDRGSRFAVEVAGQAIKEFVETVAEDEEEFHLDSDKFLLQLEKRILAKWYEAVEIDLQANPFAEDELALVSDRYKSFYLNGERQEKAYGTTLIAVCQTKSYWFGIHIGDGKCVCVQPDGTTDEPIPWDEQCQQNITTSICDSNAIEEFRHCFSTTIPIATFIGSDGVDDSYTSIQELHGLYTSILTVFAQQGQAIGLKEVEEYLPTISRKGSGDDVSISGIITFPLPSALVTLMQTQAQLDAINLEYSRLEQELRVEKEELERFLREQQKMWASYHSVSQKVGEQQDRISSITQKLDKAFDQRERIIRENERAQQSLKEEWEKSSPKGETLTKRSHSEHQTHILLEETIYPFEEFVERTKSQNTSNSDNESVPAIKVVLEQEERQHSVDDDNDATQTAEATNIPSEMASLNSYSNGLLKLASICKKRRFVSGNIGETDNE
ncbi:MAG: protein phosphatase 2C domain-containing protein [Clostridia bacterium]|nr:protein phosphatase 2C domain-containing protein [Clostridia bacterium]